MPTSLRGLAKGARRDRKARFGGLYQLLNQENLRGCFYQLRRTAAPGVDKVTFAEYERELTSGLNPHNGAAHHDVCGPGQETSAPNLPTGSLPTQGRSGRAPFQIVLLPPSGFRSGLVVRGGAFFSPPSISHPKSAGSARLVFQRHTGPPPFVWQWPRWLSCALPC